MNNKWIKIKFREIIFLFQTFNIEKARYIKTILNSSINRNTTLLALLFRSTSHSAQSKQPIGCSVMRRAQQPAQSRKRAGKESRRANFAEFQSKTEYRNWACIYTFTWHIIVAPKTHDLPFLNFAQGIQSHMQRETNFIHKTIKFIVC